MTAVVERIDPGAVNAAGFDEAHRSDAASATKVVDWTCTAVISDTHPGPRSTDAPRHPVAIDQAPAATVVTSTATSGDTGFWRWHRFGALGLDVLAVVLAFVIAMGGGGRLMSGVSGMPWMRYWVLVLVLVVAFITVVGLNDGYNRSILGTGVGEYQRVIISTLVVFGVFALSSYLLKAELSRRVFIVAMPVVMACSVVGRWVCRQVLIRARRAGRGLVATVVVGSVDAVRRLVADLEAHRLGAGYRPMAMCLIRPDGQRLSSAEVARAQSIMPGLACLSVTEVMKTVSTGQIAAVAVDGVSRGFVRQLSWELERYRVDYLVRPVTADMAADRVHVRPADGVNLIHLDLPRFRGWQYVVKRGFDIVFAACFLVGFSWLYALLAILIRAGHDGPVFFSQDRVGRDGKPFRMWKFRTMCTDAEERLAQLRAESSDGDSGLFKLAGDPRVTKVGRVLRKWSLDELPQFWNVLVGDMSVVGPRPCLERELAMFGESHFRRFLVKPGITGQWQVEGRSDLSLDDYFRLDLHYVENWSLIGDMLLVIRTVKVVLTGAGAY
ncbi:MAG: sugar transferase [Propionibacteriaceae bacterium]|jgi:exopolysaccharide biosynthesis polyprenyl glycosylphosphotransferase|nr:sugar transferase [Propionibacteriaceae bacterium]